jgi:response regulator RpfG family c-di-GMP phosphodiesterase
MKKVILYIDDEPINLMLFEVNFSEKFKVITGSSGTEGLELLMNNTDINFVVSDMKMPGMNGVEFIRKAKSQYPDVLYFILTGYEILPEIETALNETVIQKYFSKPLDIVDFENSLAQHS